MKMPESDLAVLDKRSKIISDLTAIIGSNSDSELTGGVVISDPITLKAYECDGLSAYCQRPMVVVLPNTTSQVSEVLKYCNQNNIKVVARGAGTSLSGGALPLEDAVLLGLGKFNKIVEIDYNNRCVVAQAGISNLAISDAVSEKGFYYAPDPSSQIVCSIGGNVAENSGGVHCLKYGMTTNNILGLEVVLISGEILKIGGKHFGSDGYDLLGLFTGSEGLLGIITEVTVRILPKPSVARAMLLGFDSIQAASDTVASIISEGVIPAGMEMMDKPAIHATEQFAKAGYPLESEALIIVELDGSSGEVSFLIDKVSNIARDLGSSFIQVSETEEERERFWAGRKAAFPAVGRITPDYYCMDGTIPRAKLPKVLAQTAA
ncbi:MAG: FAD-binding protein, partial [Pseudomonadota bacterium]|nr:FAD-binding protein [Pseudomonadota bacterium]